MLLYYALWFQIGMFIAELKSSLKKVE